MSEFGIKVRVQGQSIFMKSDDIQHKFTLADVRKYCNIYQIPCDTGTFLRAGKVLTDDDEIVSNDFITLDFPKAGGGLAA